MRGGVEKSIWVGDARKPIQVELRGRQPTPFKVYTDSKASSRDANVTTRALLLDRRGNPQEHTGMQRDKQNSNHLHAAHSLWRHLHISPGPYGEVFGFSIVCLWPLDFGSQPPTPPRVT